MQHHNSFFLGCNYLNSDNNTDARTGYRLYPVQDIDSVLTSGYGSNVNVEDTFSALYGDLYLRQLKETLKHTMLVHESVFESQIHELHRLYQRQKELMMEIEGTRNTTHWLSPSVSIYQTRNLPYEESIPNQTEAADDAKKTEKMVLDLELPVLEFHDGEEETSLMNGEVHEVANKLQFDLNEPAEIEEHYQFMSPVSSKESDKKNEGEGSCWMYEAQGIGIDLNMSPLSSEEEVNVVVKELGEEKPQECLSEQSRVFVQALPCLSSTLLLNELHDSYKPKKKKKKKAKLGPINKTFKESQTSHTGIIDKGSSSSVRNETKVVAKKKRKKSRKICLVKEGNYQEISAAEAMVDMSRKSDREASDFITYLSRNLLLLAEVSSLAVEGYELDYSEDTTEMNLEDHKRTLRSSTAYNKTAVSSIVFRKQKRSNVKSKHKDEQHVTFSECETVEDLQVKIDEVSDQERDCEFPKKKRRSSPLKQIEAFTSSLVEIVHWGAKSKRRRGSRIPAVDFQHMIINQ